MADLAIFVLPRLVGAAEDRGLRRCGGSGVVRLSVISAFITEGVFCLLCVIRRRSEGWPNDFILSFSNSQIFHFSLARTSQLIVSIDFMDFRRKTVIIAFAAIEP